MIEVVRVLRLVEYVGPREQVEKQISKSVHGSRSGIVGVTITAHTIGEFPELLDPDSALAVSTTECITLARKRDELARKIDELEEQINTAYERGREDCNRDEGNL